ncbi:MAG: DUF1932 domain-containing protein [Ilumatobacteraceae bacterium]
MTTTGFLHPGAMGATIAAACAGETLWSSEGRSAATRRRAEQAGLVDVVSLSGLVSRCDTIVSVCPPADALSVAESVAALGFAETYVDANAVSPMTTDRIAERFEHFVDGGIVGPPAQQRGTTRMYLSGDDAPAVATRWDGSVLDVRPIDGGVGAASAVKMLYASWGKHNAALMLAINAVAESFGVAETLRSEWAISRPDFVAESEAAADRTSVKAWRFEGEMLEIAATFAAAGQPAAFHEAAARVFGRLSGFKDADTPPDLATVVAALLDIT